ncbi:WD40 repeat-like protein [Hymenopellis radicata]|nr:WD40 repeat-like protein [Hymenopellis radicata]
MPRDLPGLYWDEERNRYFPISAKPASAAKPSTTAARNKRTKEESKAEDFPFRRRRKIPQLVNTLRNASLSFAETSRVRHAIWCSKVQSTSLVDSVRTPVFGGITAISCSHHNGRTYRLIGDDRGWLYNFDNETGAWAAQLNLHPLCRVSSISTAGEISVATCFGPKSKIVVQNNGTPERTTILTLNRVHDIWTSHLQDRSLVLGADKKAVLIRDIEMQAVEMLNTQSDVFAVSQRQNLVYAGSRSGSISRFDTRTRGLQALFENRFPAKRSSVVHLYSTDTKLLVSQMNGSLYSFDLRFARATTPVMIFDGHVNSITQRLGVAIDSSNDILFAAGEDGVIRGWSTRTGLQTFTIALQTPLQLQRSR